MAYLDGKNVSPKHLKDARLLIGKKVEYLRRMDIDKSGRGYFFPRRGIVEDVHGRNLIIGGDYVHFSDLYELVILE